MRLEALRWPLFALAAACVVLSLAAGPTAGRLLAALLGFAGWALLSRRKARSLDRQRRAPRG